MAERRAAERREAAAAGADGTSGATDTAGAAGSDGAVPGSSGGGGDGSAARRVLRGDRPPKRNILVKVGIGLVGLLTLATAALTRQPRPPGLEPNCERPAFALASPAKQHRPLAFTIVGPPDRRYALGVNTETFRNEGGEWVPVPANGRTRDDVVVVRDEPMPECHRTGVFNLPLPLGSHAVTLFELTPAGATFIQQETIDVVDPAKEDTARRPGQR